MMDATLGILGNMVDAALAKPHPWIREMCGDYYRPYYHLAHILGGWFEGETFVELGVEKGRWSGCAVLGGASVFAVDHTYRPEVARLEERFGGRFTFVEQSSLPMPRLVAERVRSVRVLHVDTEHSFAQAREEFNGYRHLLSEGSVVLFDDLHAQNDGVMKFVVELPYPKIIDDRLHECGYGVVLIAGG